MSKKDEKSLMVRLNASDKKYLMSLAQKNNSSMTKVIESLLEEHRRRSFFEGLQKDYEALRSSNTERQSEEDEQSLWDTTLSDGLEDE